MIEAGYPPSVFSIVHGQREAVEALIDHPSVKAIGFVGSSAVAKSVYRRAADHGKRALALGGAKNHLIVVPDADPDITVAGVVSSFTGCAGQRCMAASLLVAVGDCDALIDRVVEAASRFVLGREMGAIIDRASLERLHADVDRAVGEGAKLVLDGRGTPGPGKGWEDGHWMAPTVLDHARPEMECATRELFGPVLTIVRVKTLDEALALERQNRYGNATSLFTTRGATARYVAERSTSGMIGVNIGVPVPREPFSFGGTKESRFGHGDMTGRSGADFWTYLKKVTTKWAMQPDQTWMS
jgi:malonate-semialdehyde dehydrogenase (acetylating)/methylmalonate-semialdehyde dehydrogenase